MGIIMFLIVAFTLILLILSVSAIVWWYRESNKMNEIDRLPDPKERDDDEKNARE